MGINKLFSSVFKSGGGQLNVSQYKYYVVNDDYLAHHGILGMKWGVRRYQNPDGSLTALGRRRYLAGSSKASSQNLTFNSDYNERQVIKVKTKSGKELIMEQTPRTRLAKIIGRMSKKARENQMNSKFFDIKANDKTIGVLELYQESPTSVNGVWFEINKKERGQGYAQACLRAVVSDCKKRGYKQFTLEVPGSSPDARHIYEKIGFKVDEVQDMQDAAVWDGLTRMTLDLTKYK